MTCFVYPLVFNYQAELSVKIITVYRYIKLLSKSFYQQISL